MATLSKCPEVLYFVKKPQAFVHKHSPVVCYCCFICQICTHALRLIMCSLQIQWQYHFQTYFQSLNFEKQINYFFS